MMQKALLSTKMRPIVVVEESSIRNECKRFPIVSFKVPETRKNI